MIDATSVNCGSAGVQGNCSVELHCYKASKVEAAARVPYWYV